MSRSRWWRTFVALAMIAIVAAGCGDDDDSTDDASATDDTATDATEPTEEEVGEGTVHIELVDFGYEVSGPLGTGVQTFETTNSGDEIHMLGIAQLKDGASVEDFSAALQSEDQESDPFEEYIAREVDAPGHILLPGTTQRITLDDDLDVGSYALVCFLPGEGDGVPHYAKGMVSELRVVVGGGTTDEVEADAEYSLADKTAPDGPTTLPAGEVTLKLSNDGEIGKDFIVAQPDDGKEFGALDEFFVTVFEGDEPPPEGAAAQIPGKVAGNVFEIAPGRALYMTVNLEPGTWQLVSSNNVEDGEAEDFILEVTVSS